MSMSKKDYELIAKELKAQQELLGYYKNDACYRLACKLFAATLAKDNPRFNKEKFIKTCTIAND